MEEFNSMNQVWQKTLQIIENKLIPVSFNTWIKPLVPISIESDTFHLSISNSFSRDMIYKKHVPLIQSTLREITGRDFEILIKAEDAPDDTPPKEQVKKMQKQDPLDLPSNLNPRYIFDTFVVGNSNRMAHAAALAVAESPAKAYNPLFLYGGVGLGKTHLMHSIAHFILSMQPDTKVVYASSEKFTNELINSIRNNTNEKFRNRYRNIDVLLIDDIQFIADKEQTQEEFFHTFNTLYEANKQIIISSDRPPKEIKPLEERLRSRFEWGLIADIQPPDYETRIAILRKKAETEIVSVPNEVLAFVAKSIISNIRELEGALTRIIAYSTLTNRDITIELAEESLKDLIDKQKNHAVTPEYIQEVVANHYGIKTEEIRSKKRTQNITYPRQVAMYLTRKLTDISLPKIGERFGGRDHTTIIHGCDKIADELENDQNLEKTVIELEKKILGK